jgi:Cu/Ag efflux protein CusF
MRTLLRTVRPALRIALAVVTVVVGTAALPAAEGVPVAHAEEDAPLQVGTTLVARSDCELQKVVIARGAKLQVTAFGAKTVDVALQDGYVLKRVPVSRIRYFFDVVR